MQSKKEMQMQGEDDEMDIEEQFHLISEIEKHGIGHQEVKKLMEGGFFTVEAVKQVAKKNFQVKGISENKLEKIIEIYTLNVILNPFVFLIFIIYGNKILPDGFVTAAMQLQRRQNIVKITTGSKALDEALQGGMESCSITEIFGESRSGKTQMCHTLCITCQLPKEDGGGAGKAIYNTEGTFRPERLAEIAERFGMDPDEALENISYARACSVDQQNKLLLQAAQLMSESEYALLIVDSAMALYRTDFVGRGELSVRQNHLGKFLRNIQRIADEFKVAVVITNQVMSSPDSMGHADPRRPIGGNIMAHSSQTRLYFKISKGENRKCKIYDSPSLADQEVEFALTKGGINDKTD